MAHDRARQRLVQRELILQTIATEGEMKKVNWSSRKEVAVSTMIVIVVVFAMAILLGVTDVVFQFVFRQLIG